MPELTQNQYLSVGLACIFIAILLIRWYASYYQASRRRDRNERRANHKN